MDGISGIKAPSAAGVSLRPNRVRAAVAGSSPPQPAQDLAVVTPIPQSPRSSGLSQRPSAAFLAHLLATRDKAPQTRERRRAAPQDVHAAYRAASERPLPSGLLVRASA